MKKCGAAEIGAGGQTPRFEDGAPVSRLGGGCFVDAGTTGGLVKRTPRIGVGTEHRIPEVPGPGGGRHG